MTVTCGNCHQSLDLPLADTHTAVYTPGVAEVIELNRRLFFVCYYCNVVSGLDSASSDWFREQCQKSP